jgi:vacuolar iron transporter family protein
VREHLAHRRGTQGLDPPVTLEVMTTQETTRDSARRYRELLADERDAALLYRSLAASEQGERRDVFLELAAVEERHAAHWEERLREVGAIVPKPGGPTARTRLLGWLARRLSTTAVIPLIERAERAGAGVYDAEPDASPAMAADERGHARKLARLREGRPSARERIGRRERWHRVDQSGALRAGIFGISDGLVSNSALVMGFAGSGSSRSAILLAGISGLLAGSFSMAAGEYVSMAGQREMYEREIALEARELEETPDEEHDELVLLYRAKGLTRDDAQRVADQIMSNREAALDTLVREELGLDPDELGSPWQSAVSSLFTFALGAFVVIIPYLFGTGTAALTSALCLLALALTLVGTGLGMLNGKSVVRSAARQLITGGLAIGITFGVGHLLGTHIA